MRLVGPRRLKIVVLTIEEVSRHELVSPQTNALSNQLSVAS